MVGDLSAAVREDRAALRQSQAAAAPRGWSSTPEFLLGLIANQPELAGQARRGDAQTPERTQPQGERFLRRIGRC